MQQGTNLEKLRAWMRTEGVYALHVPREDMFGGEYVATCDERLAWVSGFTGSAGFAIITRDAAHLFVDGRYTLQAKNQAQDFKIHDFNKAAIDAVCDSLSTLHYDPWLMSVKQLKTWKESTNLKPVKKNPIDILWTDRPAPDYKTAYDYPIEYAGQNLEKKLAWIRSLIGKNKREDFYAGLPYKVGFFLKSIEKNKQEDFFTNLQYKANFYLKYLVVIFILQFHALLSIPILFIMLIIVLKNMMYSRIWKNKDNAIFLSNAESVCWLLNIRGGDLPHVPLLQCMALITKKNITLFCDPRKISNDLVKILNIKVVPFERMYTTIKSLRTTIVADSRTTPSALLKKGSYLNFQRKVIFNWQTDPCELPKAKKNLSEQQGMHNCHVRDAAAVVRFWMWLENQKDITEIDAQDYLETCRQKMDSYQGASFATISGFGAHGAIVHYRAEPNTNVPITQGMYLLDSGGQYLDGTTDITRTFSIGAPTQEQRIHYTLVLKGHIALANASFPIGTTGAQLDALARQHLWNNGLDYAHGTGHGVGSYLNVHEGPQGISKVRNTVLEPGMVVSNEPGLYLEGQYGIRIENLQIVKESGHKEFLCFESLTLVPYDSSLIEKSMLTQPELDWLRCYYQSILTNVSPMLNNDEHDWLKKKLSQF